MRRSGVRAGDDDVEAIGDPGELERGRGALAARRDRDPLALIAQAVDPGDRARQRAHVAVAEVGGHRLEREDRRVERVVVDALAQHVEHGGDRARAPAVERRRRSFVGHDVDAEHDRGGDRQHARAVTHVEGERAALVGRAAVLARAARRPRRAPATRITPIPNAADTYAASQQLAPVDGRRRRIMPPPLSGAPAPRRRPGSRRPSPRASTGLARLARQSRNAPTTSAQR